MDGIALRSSEDPRPRLKEILMRVRASSLNCRDLMVLKAGGRGPRRASSKHRLEQPLHEIAVTNGATDLLQ